MSERTITQNVTFAELGDAVNSRFLKDGDLVVGTGGRYFEVVTDRTLHVRDGVELVTYAAHNELGGIEALTFYADEWVKLLTVV